MHGFTLFHIVPNWGCGRGLMCLRPTGYLSSPISQPRHVFHMPFPGTDSHPPMQMPSIISNIHLHSVSFWKLLLKGIQWVQQTTRSAGTLRSYGVSLLYIKQPYTPPGVSRCQPPNSLHNLRLSLNCAYAIQRRIKYRVINPDAVCASDSHRLLWCFLFF